MTFKLLSSGYYYFSDYSSEQFAQWPSNRECLPEDCFGWYPADTARRANLARHTAILSDNEFSS